ncbi:MAG: formate--tetrahydrofolate ligase [Planctomycetota bacterium]|nr:formate--tetrahydrofolate ligase [Planctomycetota bacterium]
MSKALNDLEIARTAKLRPLEDVARTLDLLPEDLEMYGRTKAKVDLGVLDRPTGRTPGKYVLVTAITPTPLGEGKTLHAVGLSMSLNRIGKKSVCTIRQPSMGPVFGIKGGAAGGGYCQVIPPEEFNLHLTGDFHAVTAANNLLAAFLDTSLIFDNPHDIDPESITWRRVMDMNDRALRDIEIGLGGSMNGVPRRTGFDITAASEVMAALGLSEDLKNLRRRLSRIVVGSDSIGKPVTAGTLRAAGAMAALLKDAIKPTLMQTLEGTPALIHTGPFANIAHGNSSIVADRIGLRSTDFVVTEAGFGADMGAEKFFNIKCRIAGFRPDVAVLVATVRALKMHSGRFHVVGGKPLPPEMLREDLDAVRAGLVNLEKQIENVRLHGVPVVVAINHFPTDTAAETELVREAALAAGAQAAEVTKFFTDGGAGGEELANAVAEAADSESDFQLLYPDDMRLSEKIETIATKIYGARSVEYSDLARDQLSRYEELGWGTLPICMAKTQYSLSHDPKMKGRPSDFIFPIQEVRVSAGAGFVYPLAGKIMTMPGLGRRPGGMQIDLDEDDQIVGMF